MKNLVFTIGICLTTIGVFGQRVKVKKGIVSVDKMEYLRMSHDKLTWDYSFYNIASDVELVYAKCVTYQDPNVWNTDANGNITDDPHGVVYWEIHVEGMDDFFEVDVFGKHIAKLIYNSGIVSMEGAIDTTKTKKYMNRRGKDHTRRRTELSNQQDKVIVIDNRTVVPAQPRRNRVGVRIGGVSVELND